jgi:hypothetical protein
MTRCYFPQIHLAIPETEKLLTFQINELNLLNKDEKGKWLKGAKILRPGHLNTLKALLQLLMRNDIFRQNYIYTTTGRGIYNTNKPLVCIAYTSDIKNMLVEGLKSGVSAKTIKNYMDRLQEYGIITRKWKRGTEKFQIEFNHEFLVLKNPDDGEFVKNIAFEKYSNSIIYKSKSKNLPYSTKEDIKINNKIIHSENVNKRDLHSQISSSLKKEPLENVNKKVQLQEEQQRNENLNHSSIAGSSDIVGERLTDMDNTKNNEIRILNSKKKDAANIFYTKFISLFWNFWIQLYMPETAPKETMFYISQSIDTLVNDDYYFGTCQNEEQINYQLQKLNKSLNSAHNWYKNKQKNNENFSFRYLYPNVFLKNKAGSGSMSFKNSILKTEMQMAKNNLLQIEYEKAMQREKDKKTKQKHNQIVDNIIAWVHSNSKDKTTTLIYQAQQYLLEINPELLMKLQTDWSNPYRVKQAIESVKEFDHKMINEIFIPQETIKQEIDTLLPKMQKLLQSRKLTISQKMLVKFDIRGEKMQPVPKNYDKHTLQSLKYLIK